MVAMMIVTVFLIIQTKIINMMVTLMIITMVLYKRRIFHIYRPRTQLLLYTSPEVVSAVYNLETHFIQKSCEQSFRRAQSIAGEFDRFKSDFIRRQLRDRLSTESTPTRRSLL